MTDTQKVPAPSGRGSWPVRRFRLGQHPGDDLHASTTAETRLAMMWPLALDAWAASGRELPDYRRDETPVRKSLAATSDGS